MPRDFFPRPDAKAVQWTANFSQRINLDPAAYFLSIAQAAEYAVMQAEFADAYFATQNPSTNSTTSTRRKKEARKVVEAETRRLGTLIRGTATVTLAQKFQLGLKERGKPTRINRPESAPRILVRSVVGRTARVELLDTESGKRKMPKGVRGASIFSHVGETPPTDPAQWNFRRNTSVTRVTVSFPASLPPGATVWLTARWINPRSQHGPSGLPTNMHLGYEASLPTLLKAA